MKQQLKATMLLVFTSVIMLAFISPKHRLPGKWTIYNSDRIVIGEYLAL